MENLKETTTKFQGNCGKSKELRLVTVAIGTKGVRVNDLTKRTKKGKKKLRFTGDENYISTKDGVIYHQTAKVVRQMSHRAGITNW
jgi:hypothetical protein